MQCRKDRRKNGALRVCLRANSKGKARLFADRGDGADTKSRLIFSGENVCYGIVDKLKYKLFAHKKSRDKHSLEYKIMGSFSYRKDI